MADVDGVLADSILRKFVTKDGLGDDYLDPEVASIEATALDLTPEETAYLWRIKGEGDRA